ncbi:hypothetical protein [Candidatus Pantoea multigeneris]|uniref:Secreted protein n=1 Tax=Candidatus Pantoea multigeneris TaxID=2608357 RepID=A0ABX0R652_9GAMM|nr:hypothetical protein [Pantoea multigeneris]NIF20254.1 hypothetical protein [Pantoea multigeneris]
MRKIMVFLGLFILTSQCFAVTICGPFTLSSGPNDGWFRINGEKPDTQKVTFLKRKEGYDNIQVQWMLPRSDAPGWLGLDYVKRNGKAVLNVEAIRSNMDQPRVFGSFDCKKV